MPETDMYVPMNKLILYKSDDWVFTKLNMAYCDIVKQGIVMWCVEHLECKWTMLGSNKFGFENGEDATMFRIQFCA